MNNPSSGDPASGRRELATMLGMYWIYLREAEKAVRKRFGDAGIRALTRSFRKFGLRRGQYLRDLPEVICAGRTPRALLENWDTGDLVIAAGDDNLSVTSSATHVDATFRVMPGIPYFQEEAGVDLLGSFWAETLEGIRAGYDESLILHYRPPSPTPGAEWGFSFRLTAGGSAGTRVKLPERLTNDAERIRLVRRTIGTLGILITSVGRELRRDFDGAGEAIFRKIAYNFGAARGGAIRQMHESAGRSLDFTSFFDGIQERDRHETTFVYARNRHISPGVAQLDCTYCPLAEAWAAEGPDGMKLAYQFDVENHLGLIESYDPRAIVRWDAIKSRGDDVCKFRFVIPELVSDEDPEWAQALRSSPGSG